MGKKPTLRQTERFHRKRGGIKKIIKGVTDPDEVLFGAEAVNQRVPPFLRIETVDLDIMTPNSRRDAFEAERALDKAFGGDFFNVIQARDPKTLRVKSNIDGKVYVDYRQTDKKIKSTKKGGINVATRKELKRLAKKSIRNPEARFRREKDRDILNRLKIAEQIKKRKKSRKRTKKGDDIFKSLINSTKRIKF